jgi:uncharacterized membrane protein HdeD (DUF308 family)
VSTDTVLAVAFLVVASASLAVHVGALVLITRDGAGEWLPIGYKRVTTTLWIRVFGAALYTLTGVVAVLAAPITALAALAVFTVMTVLYGVSSVRDCRYWRHQRGQERRAGGHHGPGAPRRPTIGRRCHVARVQRPPPFRPSPVPRV